MHSGLLAGKIPEAWFLLLGTVVFIFCKGARRTLFCCILGRGLPVKAGQISFVLCMLYRDVAYLWQAYIVGGLVVAHEPCSDNFSDTYF